jgi:deoxyribonuclease-4
MLKKNHATSFTSNRPKIGAHVPASGGVDNAFINAEKIGAEAFQFFITPPQMWVKSTKNETEVQRFREKAVDSGITETYIHGTYLVNLGTPTPEHLQKSIDWLIYALNTAADLQARGVIFHLGSHKGNGFENVLPQITSALTEILKNSKPGSYLLLENSAGAGGNIGSSFKDLGAILKQVQSDRLKICLDTQHAFAAGIDIKTEVGLEAALLEFEEEIGLEHLLAIHCNDSKTDFGSGKDRHENIGEGQIGKDAFARMLNHPKLAHVTFILEVPGMDQKSGPDLENINILKSLLK